MMKKLFLVLFLLGWVSGCCSIQTYPNKEGMSDLQTKTLLVNLSQLQKGMQTQIVYELLGHPGKKVIYRKTEKWFYKLPTPGGGLLTINLEFDRLNLNALEKIQWRLTD